jgi:hypothetical protein
MSTFESNRVADAAGRLQDGMRANFGRPIAIEQTLLVDGHDRLLATLRGVVEGRIKDARLIPANMNIAALKQEGRGFGVLRPTGVHPAIISPRAVSPAELWRQKGLSAPTRFLLQGMNPIQRKNVGVDHAPNTVGVATELGHSVLGLSAVTSKVVSASLAKGHIVHGLAEASTGIMPTLGRPRTDGELGMLSFKDRPFLPDELVVTADTPVWLVDHPIYRSISRPVEEIPVNPVEGIVGHAVVAAQNQLGVDDTKIGSFIMGQMERI